MGFQTSRGEADPATAATWGRRGRREWRERAFVPSIFGLALAAFLGGAAVAAAAADDEILAKRDGGISGREIAAIAADPRLLLKNSVFGAERLAWRVRVLATAGPRGLRAIGRAIPLADDAQKSSIGQGLARAALVRDRVHAISAAQIADLIRDVGDIAVTDAFTNYLTNAADTRDPPARPEPAAGGAKVPPSGAMSDARRYFDAPIDRDAGAGDP
jgi:hypothetical protein